MSGLVTDTNKGAARIVNYSHKDIDRIINEYI